MEGLVSSASLRYSRREHGICSLRRLRSGILSQALSGYYRKNAVNALGHYLVRGRQEGRRPTSGTDKFPMDGTRIDHRRETVLLISHEASRTGAPIIAWNIAMRLRHRYNVVALLIGSGELVASFEDCCAAVVGPIGYADPHRSKASTSSGAFWRPIQSRMPSPIARIPTFRSCPRCRFRSGGITDPSSLPPILVRKINGRRFGLVDADCFFNRDDGKLGQGRASSSRQAIDPCSASRPVRNTSCTRASVFHHSTSTRQNLPSERMGRCFGRVGRRIIHIRKGVELFVACAAAVSAMKPKRPVRFIWIGGGYDPVNGIDYSTYLAEQIARSGSIQRSRSSVRWTPGSRLRA